MPIPKGRELRSTDRIFESPVGSGGNDGALPTSYDDQWQLFRNLTPSQIAWYQSHPNWLVFYAATSGWHKEINSITVDGVLVETDQHSAAVLRGHAIQTQYDPPSATYVTRHRNTITAQQAIAMAKATDDHIQNCRSQTAQIISDIKAGKVKSMDDIGSSLATIQTSVVTK